MTLQEYEVKRVEPFSFGKISAAFTALAGLITGIIYLPFITLMAATSGAGGSSIPMLLGGLLLGVILLIFLSVIYAGVGFAMGVFYGYVYNYISKKVGGIEMVMDVEG